MSWLNWNKWSDLTAVLNGGTVRRRKSSPASRNRRLTLDPLEERQLLSVSPGHVDDQLVAAMSDVSSQYTLAAQSIGVDHDGNFVITWTRNDPIYNSDGDLIATESNIYARYYTDEVQRITLPVGALDNANPNTYARFDLTYGGNEIQQLTITTTTPGPNDFAMRAAGTVTLGFGGSTATFQFDEYDPVGDNAAAIQTALRSMGGALADVEVEGINPQTYNIRFGNASGGMDQPRVQVESINLSGFLPAVQVNEIREPITIYNIPVFPNDPWRTATAIEAWFSGYATGEFPIGPIDFPGPGAVPPAGPYQSPDSMIVGIPRVSVVPVFTLAAGQEQLTFDITFVGDSGKVDHPELVVSAVRSETGALLSGATVRTIKEPSPEFRVNAAEPDKPDTPFHDKTNQGTPAVAMDADGDFVITWTSVVPNSVTYGSVTDIFARRFSPQAIVASPSFYADMNLDGIEETAIQGVRALGDQFRVNTATTGAQGQPSIGMDDDGNFVIAWSNTAQTVSFFNGIMAQRFNRDGERVGNEWLVNTEDTEIHEDSFVAMSYDGYFLVTWTRTIGQAGTVFGELYNPTGTVLTSQFAIGGGGLSTAAFDMDRNFIVGWEALRDNDNIPVVDAYRGGIYARQYGMNFNTSGVFTGLRSIRTEFRVNSASFNPNSRTLWTGNQGGHQVAIDADGDLVVSYDGFGPDASYDAVIPYSWYLEQFLLRPENADLIQFFNGLPIEGFYFNSGDVTGEIEEVLFGASSVPRTATQTATRSGEVHTLTISESELPDDAIGYFRVRVDGQWTNPIAFDPDNLGQVATNVGNAIRALSPLYANVTVLITPSEDGFQIVIDFTPAIPPSVPPTAPPTATLQRSRVTQVATSEQLGRLRAILDGVAGLMRGEANGVLFSRFDSHPELGTHFILGSDNIANATRDGENQRYIISLDGAPERRWESFLLRLYHPWCNGYEEVRVNAVLNEDFTMNMVDTAEAIRSALAGLQRTGVNWPYDDFEGPIDVRIVSAAEIQSRLGTRWDLTPGGVNLAGTGGSTYTDYVFEITFQGEVHDTPMALFARDGWAVRDEVQILTFTPTSTDPTVPLVGRFTLSAGGDTTDPLTFNSANLDAMANAIQNALRNELGFDDAIVEALPGGPPYRFRVWFAGDSGETNHPGIQGAPFVVPEESPSTALNGTISSFTEQDGGRYQVAPPDLFQHTAGFAGTPQYNASIGMTPDGSFVVAWTQTNLYNNGLSAGNSIHFRTFTESTDTAGPMATDFLLATGERLQNGGQVTVPLNYIIVTFDEDMEREGQHAVTNVNNWALLRDGVLVQGGISQVFFGMNAAADMSSVLGVNIPGTNKWEAVIIFDGNGMADGVTALGDGNYQVVALNSMRDRPGNALGRTGYEINGQVFRRDFNVTLPKGG
ncbi:MAG: hypothetical protein U1E05_04215, partial [Patescibacteria group bacterium]|nr:hypothetical protein [Patescibacteria group bacterium]